MIGILIVGGIAVILIADDGPASSVIASTVLPGIHSIPRRPPGTGTALPKKPFVPAGGKKSGVSVPFSLIMPRISSDSPSGTLNPFMLRFPLRFWMSTHASLSKFLAVQPEKFGKTACADPAAPSHAIAAMAAAAARAYLRARITLCLSPRGARMSTTRRIRPSHDPPLCARSALRRRPPEGHASCASSDRTRPAAANPQFALR